MKTVIYFIVAMFGGGIGMDAGVHRSYEYSHATAWVCISSAMIGAAVALAVLLVLLTGFRLIKKEIESQKQN